MTNFKNYFPPYFLYLAFSVSVHFLATKFLPTPVPSTPFSFDKTRLGVGVGKDAKELLVFSLGAGDLDEEVL